MGLISTLCYVLSYKNLRKLKLCFISEGYMQNFNISSFSKFEDQFEVIEFVASEIIRKGNPSNDIDDYQVTNVAIDESVAIITIY